MKRTKEFRRIIRHHLIRKKVTGTVDRPRICVHKSLKHIYVTVSDDASRPEGSLTLVSVSTNTKKNKEGDGKSFRNIENATKLGKTVGSALIEKGVKQAVFDRAGYRYHGCIKALADGLRESGLNI